MTVVVPIFPPVPHFVDSNGNALVGGLLFSYQGGTLTKSPLYTDSTGTTQYSDPIVLNARGEPPAGASSSGGIWFPPNTTLKLILSPAGDTDPPTNPIWTVDGIQQAPDTFGTMATQNSNAVNITGGTISNATLSSIPSIAVSNLTVTGSTTFAGIAFNISGNVTLNGVNNTLNVSPTGGPAIAALNAPTGQNAVVEYETAGSLRWQVLKNNATETGGNVGSDFGIQSYADNGTLLATPVIITRATGAVALSGALAVTGAATFNGTLTLVNNNSLVFQTVASAAGGNTGTLNNAPIAADPAYWIPVTIAGTTYAIPAWAI